MEVLKVGSTGPDVKVVQSLLNRTAFNAGTVDGVFGRQTQQAVMGFQRLFGLSADGVVGAATWAIMEKYLKGYDVYTVRPGDTLYRIAKNYGTTVRDIVIANPGVNLVFIYPGQRLVVPYWIEVVFTDVDYTYDEMVRDIEGLKARYPFLETGIAGKSVLGRNLYYLRLGRGPREVFYNASHHAIEWITTPLVMKFAENYLKAYAQGTSLRGYDIPKLWDQVSIYIMPMVNPDGVDLAIRGLTRDNPYYSQLLQWNRTGQPFSKVWKANIRGVDLNRNYPAGWEQAKAMEPSLGIRGPGPTRFGGPYPLSEPETQAVVNFTKAHNFRLVIAYHTQGRVIYWTYQNLTPPESRSIAEAFARISGYEVSNVPYEASYAGYKDWFIQEYRRPGFTMEVGSGTSPVPLSQFPGIYNENEGVMLLGATL